LEIKGLDRIKESIVFHAGTAVKENKIVTSGGRVLAVTSFGENIHEALKKSYASIEEVHYERKYFRKDIGFDL
jgi:phosphoribosylamine--glycine ligase